MAQEHLTLAVYRIQVQVIPQSFILLNYQLTRRPGISPPDTLLSGRLPFLTSVTCKLCTFISHHPSYISDSSFLRTAVLPNVLKPHRLPREVVMEWACWSSKSIWITLRHGLILWWSSGDPGVGLDDICGSLPTQAIQWFYDIPPSNRSSPFKIYYSA